MHEQTEDYTIPIHFIGREVVVREIYDCLLARLREFGQITEDPKKTCIHLAASKSALGGVYPRKNYLNLEFKTAYAIDNPRISKSEQVSRYRYHNSLRLDSVEAIDDEVMAWLRDAYEISV